MPSAAAEHQLPLTRLSIAPFSLESTQGWAMENGLPCCHVHHYTFGEPECWCWWLHSYNYLHVSWSGEAFVRYLK